VTPSLLDLFRVLSSLAPPRAALADAPWGDFVTWAVEQGVAPLAAYNLEYRLAGAAAPESAREQLLSVYQGSVNDSVMKWVNFKRAIDELEGRRVVLLGGASFTEALYPHVAFRPVLDVEALVPRQDLDAVAEHLLAAEFKQVAPEAGEGADRVLCDGRTRIVLYADLLGPEVLSRVLPMKVYGPSVFRLAHEDAILGEVLGHAQSGYEVAGILWVDFRELVAGAPSTGGPYTRTPDAGLVRERARAWKLERTLWTSLSVVSRMFPDVAPAAARLLPELPSKVAQELEAAVAAPVGALSGPGVRGEALARMLG
jgi:hypothetical protein